MANCPYQNQARDAWWKRQLSNGATLPIRSIPSPVGNLSGNTQQEDQENCQGELLKKSAGEVPVDSPIDSKSLKEIKRMLESEKNSPNSTSVDDTSHTFAPTPNIRNGFRRRKGDSPFVYNLNLKVKKERNSLTIPILIHGLEL